MSRPVHVVAAALRAGGCVFADEEARLLIAAAGDGADLDVLLARRTAGTPLEHLLGWVAFAGRRFTVAPGVFVPRRRTEFLAAAAAARVRPGDVVVELCCGAAVVSAVIAAAVARLSIHAADIDARAARTARVNLPADAAVHVGDLFEALPAGVRGTIDLLVANAPYVPTAEIATMPSEARDHEPRAALDGGSDGTDVQRRLIAEAPAWLQAGGYLLLETTPRHAPKLVALATAAGFTSEVAIDEGRASTVLIAQRVQGALR